MAGNGLKWLEIADNSWKRLEMAGNGLNGWKWLNEDELEHVSFCSFPFLTFSFCFFLFSSNLFLLLLVSSYFFMFLPVSSSFFFHFFLFLPMSSIFFPVSFCFFPFISGSSLRFLFLLVSSWFCFFYDTSRLFLIIFRELVYLRLRECFEFPSSLGH